MTLRANLRQRRTQAGLSQAELAERVDVSRQAVGAIEAGRQVPSTELALRLARALRCSVEDLFQLPDGGAFVQAHLSATSLPPGARLHVGRVGGRLVAHPVLRADRAADCLLRGEASPSGLATVELLGDPSEMEDHIFVAGCAPLLGLLTERLGRRYRRTRASWIPADSSRALALLEQRLVHVAGVHLADAHDPEAHRRAARRLFPDQPASVIHLARWRQGLLVPAGNPHLIEVGDAMLRPELRYVVRDSGAAAQRLLEATLREIGADAPPAIATRASDHAEVARAVRWGVADLGVAIESVALTSDLDFIPLRSERFDLILPTALLDSPAVARLLDLIDRPAFRAEAASLPGYDLSRAGELSSVSPTPPR